MSNCAEGLTTKQNILQATLDLIKTEGADQVTLRKITAAANVNLALVNYHFGSKDNLINEALKMLLTTFQANFDVLGDTSLSPKDRLKAFLLQYVDSVLQYPGLLHEVLGKGRITFESRQDFTDFMKTTGFSKITSVLEEITGESNSDILFIMMMQINAAVLFPLVLAKQIKQMENRPSKEIVERQIDILFDHYFAKYDSCR
ncbi:MULTISPECIES: TetR/AcrR family transcriptional regulator [Paenibacillus]|jgi:AcrR family transcriptional regulator|uniref:Transcriptional regulator, TetR family n=1 Tax=Paenibacillus barengoltzii J12 TaxID=935846 RepID=A0ABY1LVX9_9BACL|nr:MULTISPECIES: TetR/AcrR family transcriptional regulator [Paenibacillus]MEC2344288.1 TetR/AcrR family transcriptional regulator [Paenibacillus barengoltzii]SMF02347.1 transcriptional regulator, TetR family [Paenibacillus barengoltzii]SMF16047.1 transcriptional regulator, TetR family [Paenibacillus barengoltzii J12]